MDVLHLWIFGSDFIFYVAFIMNNYYCVQVLYDTCFWWMACQGAMSCQGLVWPVAVVALWLKQKIAKLVMATLVITKQVIEKLVTATLVLAKQVIAKLTIATLVIAKVVISKLVITKLIIANLVTTKLAIAKLEITTLSLRAWGAITGLSHYSHTVISVYQYS